MDVYLILFVLREDSLTEFFSLCQEELIAS